MPQEIPNAPSAQEVPEYASRLREVRSMTQSGKSGKRSKKQREQEGDSPLRSSGEVSRSGLEPQSYLEAQERCADAALETADGTFVESWDDLFGLQENDVDQNASGKGGSRAGRIIGFGEALRRKAGSFREAAGRDAGKRPTVSDASEAEWLKDAAGFPGAGCAQGEHAGHMQEECAEKGPCVAAACSREMDLASVPSPSARVRPPRKKPHTRIVYREGAPKVAMLPTVAVAASTSLVVCIVVMTAGGMLGTGTVLEGIAGWLM